MNEKVLRCSCNKIVSNNIVSQTKNMSKWKVMAIDVIMWLFGYEREDK